jgi:hypothetical protein
MEWIHPSQDKDKWCFEHGNEISGSTKDEKSIILHSWSSFWYSLVTFKLLDTVTQWRQPSWETLISFK